jgi:hypothetical protein
LGGMKVLFWSNFLLFFFDKIIWKILDKYVFLV